MKRYPMRLTRNIWNIPLNCIHTCSESTCALNIQYEFIDDEMMVYIEENPGSLCEYSNMLVQTSVNLCTYDYSKPCGYYGELLHTNDIVIPDNTFSVLVSFPLTHSVSIQVHKQNSLGYTLRELLNIIKYIYGRIYEEELRTSTSTCFLIEKPCECIDMSPSMFITNIEDGPEDTCCICLRDTNHEECSQLVCNHTFHKTCIHTWLNKKQNCPLCRSSIIQCTICDNKQFIEEELHAVVLPIEYRFPPNSYARNHTDGRYGIHTWDFEDLMLNNLVYNRLEKTLLLQMSVNVD